MEAYLLDSVKRTLMSELQARGYAPHISDVNQAAIKVIALVEADLKARLLTKDTSESKAAVTELDEVEVEPSPSVVPSSVVPPQTAS